MLAVMEGPAVSSLTIRHVTTYRYRRPVVFGEHRMMLRPRDSHVQRVLEARLRIFPEPESLHFVQDAYGNHVGVARFSGRAKSLRFESVVRLEHSAHEAAALDAEGVASAVPGVYSADEAPDLAQCIQRHQSDPDDEIGHWARRFLPEDGSIGAFALLDRMSHGIRRDFHYRRREEKGIQSAVETLRFGHGSCRDFAVLLIEAARSFGIAARFVSGYLAPPLDDFEASSHGSTHAWAQAYLPGAGWVDFDPTNGGVGAAGLITVAVVRDPRQALPLHGVFTGFASDSLGMEVEVSVTPEAPVDFPARRRQIARPDGSNKGAAALTA